MGYMRISSTEKVLVILSQTKYVKMLKRNVQNVPNQAEAKTGWCYKPIKLQCQ